MELLAALAVLAALLDSQSLRSLAMEVRDGKETWRPGSNEFDLGHGVFSSEAWPPEWHPLPEDVSINWGEWH